MVNSTLVKVNSKKQKTKYNYRRHISYFVSQAIETKIPLDLWGPARRSNLFGNEQLLDAIHFI